MRRKLMCLPYSGAGAGIYRPWTREDSPLLEAVPIQLPGREEEFTRPFYASLDEAAQGTAQRILAAADGNPYLLFGHSFGALLAYETARHLLKSGQQPPEQLIVSGALSPRHGHLLVISDDDDQAVADLQAELGQDVEALRNPELRALLLPILRADVRLASAHMSGNEPLPIPLTALRGADDVAAPRPLWRDWSTFTTDTFRSIEMPGGHMYLTDSWPTVWRTIEGLL
jgi:surfactin synthase thioesterase subunit